MKTSKFFRFTIAGDELNVAELKGKISLDSSVYYKNVPIEKKLGAKKNVYRSKHKQMGIFR